MCCFYVGMVDSNKDQNNSSHIRYHKNYLCTHSCIPVLRSYTELKKYISWIINQEWNGRIMGYELCTTLAFESQSWSPVRHSFNSSHKPSIIIKPSLHSQMKLPWLSTQWDWFPWASHIFATTLIEINFRPILKYCFLSDFRSGPKTLKILKVY